MQKKQLDQEKLIAPYLPRIFFITMKMTQNEKLALSVIRDVKHNMQSVKCKENDLKLCFYLLLFKELSKYLLLDSKEEITAEHEEFYLYKCLDENSSYGNYPKLDILNNLDHKTILKGVELLPFRLRFLLLLSYIEGFSYTDLEKITAYSQQQIQLSLCEGRKQLQINLKRLILH